MTEHIRNQIEDAKRKVVRKILSFISQQRPQWQKIPWLALQADGRSGYSDCYSYCYHHGMLRVGQQHSGSPIWFIDCATGDLYRWKTKVDENDFDVLSESIEEFDAECHIEEMTREHHISYPDYMTVAEVKRREAWRTEMIRKLDLSEVYERHEEIPEPIYGYD